jgi:4'-phosphopantetheinyl transferase
LKAIFKLESNTVNTWFININDVQDKFEKFSNIISIDEKKRANKFHFKKDKNLFIMSRVVLRLLSGKYLNIEPETITFKYGKYGKPDFDFDTNLKFNISHSGEMVILSFVLDYDIGVDIEKIKHDFDVLDIATNYFSKLEIEALKKAPKEKQSEFFYRCWTRKESFIKAKSIGLSFPLDQFSVSINSDKQVDLLETKWDKNEFKSWSLFSFSPDSDYIGAISVNGKINNVKFLSLSK